MKYSSKYLVKTANGLNIQQKKKQRINIYNKFSFCKDIESWIYFMICRCYQKQKDNFIDDINNIKIEETDQHLAIKNIAIVIEFIQYEEYKEEVNKRLF